MPRDLSRLTDRQIDRLRVLMARGRDRYAASEPSMAGWFAALAGELDDELADRPRQQRRAAQALEVADLPPDEARRELAEMAADGDDDEWTAEPPADE